MLGISSASHPDSSCDRNLKALLNITKTSDVRGNHFFKRTEFNKPDTLRAKEGTCFETQTQTHLIDQAGPHTVFLGPSETGSRANLPSSVRALDPGLGD